MAGRNIFVCLYLSFILLYFYILAEGRLWQVGRTFFQRKQNILGKTLIQQNPGIDLNFERRSGCPEDEGQGGESET